jgi:hypothetical protein
MKKSIKLKTIQIPQETFKEMQKIYKYFCEIYGDEDTVWDFDDVNEMREAGQEFMTLFFTNIKNKIA